ncbi:uncharacterized protein LOC144865622 [Branchiostoma floridae x Branchiostoma japonicum]
METPRFAALFGAFFLVLTGVRHTTALVGSLSHCKSDDHCVPWEFCAKQPNDDNGMCMGKDCYKQVDCVTGSVCDFRDAGLTGGRGQCAEPPKSTKPLPPPTNQQAQKNTALPQTQNPAVQAKPTTVSNQTPPKPLLPPQQPATLRQKPMTNAQKPMTYKQRPATEPQRLVTSPQFPPAVMANLPVMPPKPKVPLDSKPTYEMMKFCMKDADCDSTSYCESRENQVGVCKQGRRPAGIYGQVCGQDTDCGLGGRCDRTVYYGIMGICRGEKKPAPPRQQSDVPLPPANPMKYCFRDRDCTIEQRCDTYYMPQYGYGICAEDLSALSLPKSEVREVVLKGARLYGSAKTCRGDRDCPKWEYCSDQSGVTVGLCTGQDCYHDADCEGAKCKSGSMNPKRKGYCMM